MFWFKCDHMTQSKAVTKLFCSSVNWIFNIFEWQWTWKCKTLILSGKICVNHLIFIAYLHNLHKNWSMVWAKLWSPWTCLLTIWKTLFCIVLEYYITKSIDWSIILNKVTDFSIPVHVLFNALNIIRDSLSL